MRMAEVFVAILVSAVCTFLLRALPFVVFAGERKMPAWLEKLGQALPAAIMAVLIVYCLKDGVADFKGVGISQCIAVVVVAISYKWKHSTFLSILLGTGSYMVLLRIL